MELENNFTIIFSPSLQSPSPNQLISTPSAKNLLAKHLSLMYKKNEENEKPLTIQEKKLTHESNQSFLFIRFLEKMRYNSTEYIKLSVLDPWLYRSPQKEPNQKVIYLKEQEYKISIDEKKERTVGKHLKQAANLIKVVISVTASLSILAKVCSIAGGTSVYLIKFFNIIDIISNLSKLNVEFGPNLELVIKFIENVSIPEIKFLAKLSPLEDSNIDDPDVNAYQLLPRGSRGKITTSNREIFIASGQNFIIGTFIIVLRTIQILLGFCLDKKSRILGFVTFLYQMVFGIMFFDYQFICTSEISLFYYHTHRKNPFKFTLSLLLSIFLLLLIIYDFYHGYKMIGIHMARITQEKESEEKINISKNDEFMLEKYTEGLKEDSSGNQIYLIWFENMRFFVIQVIIASLQLLNRTQALLVFLLNLTSFSHFIRLVVTRKVFSSKLLLIKMIVQEC